MATENYERMAYRLYESNWIGCPVHLQKHLIIMTRDMQQSLHYHGFGLVSLNLETFNAVCNSGIYGRIQSLFLEWFMIFEKIWFFLWLLWWFFWWFLRTISSFDPLIFSFLFLWFQMIRKTYEIYTLFKTITNWVFFVLMSAFHIW